MEEIKMELRMVKRQMRLLSSELHILNEELRIQENRMARMIKYKEELEKLITPVKEIPTKVYSPRTPKASAQINIEDMGQEEMLQLLALLTKKGETK